MTVLAGPPSQGAGAVFELVAEFLAKCQLEAAARAVRAECSAKEPVRGAEFLKHLKDLSNCCALLLTELEAEAGTQRAGPSDEETLLDHLIDSSLQRLVSTGGGTPDAKLGFDIDRLLGSKAFADLTAMKGARSEHKLAPPHPAGGVGPPPASPTGAAQALPRFADRGGHDKPPLSKEARSPHYSLPAAGSRVAGGALEGDEYHDDEDPGYRIREIYEAELLAELAHRSALAMRGSQNPRAPAPSEAPAASPQAEAEATSPRAGSQCNRSPRAAKDVRYEPSGDAFYPVELDGVVYDSFNLRIVHERDKTGFEESKEFQISVNSVIAARYQIVEYLGSAAFSRAVQCLDLERNKMVCMKIIKNDKDFFDQSLDEIKLLKYLNVNGNVDEHRILRLYDYFYYKEHLIIVTELLRDNLYEFSKFLRDSGDPPYFTLGRLQKVSKQVLTALEYIHSLRLIHCDLKPENILIQSYSNCEVKVIDFGSSCFVDDHLSSYVQSRSYRAPEVMLGVPYDQKVDIWSLGCIIAELWTGYVLFQNDSVQSLLARIIGIVGEFPYHIMTRGRSVPQYFTQDGQLYQEIDGHACAARGRRLHLLVPKKTSLKQRMSTDSADFLDFLGQLLQLDASRRPTAREALEHPFLTQCCYSDGL
mmetsp:Transcript_111146/g.314586  ORF Transcript_111146/g.314586 Transcript_111146/m.314586 type:complete len:647 (-) Transcript_111146:51-1991(-)